MMFKTFRFLTIGFMSVLVNMAWGQKQEIPLRKNKQQPIINDHPKAPEKPFNKIQAYYDDLKVVIEFKETLNADFRVILCQQQQVVYDSFFVGNVEGPIIIDLPHSTSVTYELTISFHDTEVYGKFSISK